MQPSTAISVLLQAGTGWPNSSDNPSHFNARAVTGVLNFMLVILKTVPEGSIDPVFMQDNSSGKVATPLYTDYPRVILIA
jgi:hypothetical protein